MISNQNVLFLVPHPDDEINIGAGLIDLFKQRGMIVSVAFITYGDYKKEEAKVRVEEALKAKNILGYDNIFWGGYGDDYRGRHLYECNGSEKIKSIAGYDKTYNVGTIYSYYFSKYGKQHDYTRDNYKSDLKELILDLCPEYIVCVDSDKHVEHKALSLLFDEVMGELLKETEYRPYVYKKFAYIGVYDSVRDYFCRPMIETLPSVKGIVQTKDIVYPHLWEERIRIQNNPCNYPLKFWLSPIFKALLAHHSQRAAIRFVQICNSDIILWNRRTDSLSYNAEFHASSGDVQYLNDFKIADFDTIRTATWDIKNTKKKLWISSAEDLIPQITIELGKKSNISEIVLYQPYKSRICKIDVYLDGLINITHQCEDSYKIIIPIKNNKQATKKILLKIYPQQKSCASLNEIEIYEKNNVENGLPFNEMSKTSFGRYQYSWFYSVLFNVFSILYMDKYKTFKKLLKKI